MVRFLDPTLKRYNRLYPELTPIRGDSEFAVPELYELAEAQNATYVIRLKAKRRLEENAQEALDQIPDDVKEATPVFYRDFRYKASSWNRSRRVVVKMEKPADELFFALRLS